MLRPIADKINLSRERLAYIVDSTAAPVAGIAVVSSWVAVEMAVIDSGLKTTGIADSAFDVFIRSIPYCFYCIFALVFMFVTSITGREYGPMLKAERRARAARGSAEPTSPAQEMSDSSVKKETAGMLVAFGSIALLVLYLVTFLIAGQGDTITLLLQASFLSSTAALVICALLRILPPGEGIKAWLGGVTNVVPTLVVLLLAWSLAGIGESFLPICVAAVLSGGIFGDHCSPMTDCTILAALGSGCDVMDHAVTQMPYAFTVALVSMICIIFATLGVNTACSIALGVLILSAVILLFGKHP